MKSHWIEHQGKKIFRIDLSNFQGDVSGFRAELDAASSITVQQPERSVRVLTDLSNTIITTAIMQIAQESSAKTTRHVYKTAVIGLKSFQRIFLETITAFSRQELSAFKDVEAALDWLAKD